MNLFSSLLLINLAVAGGADQLKEKPWKVFKNTYGYELKIPDCWEAQVGGNYEEAPVNRNMDVHFAEGEKCKTPPKSPTAPNGVMITLDVYKGAKKNEMQDKLTKREKMEKNRLQNKINLYFQRTRLGNSDAVVYVETLGGSSNDIRWNSDIICGNKIMRLSGPSILNPDPSVTKKLQDGDFALPEPEKTIWESFRCVDSKSKK